MFRSFGLAAMMVTVVAAGCVGPSAERFARIRPGSATRQEVVGLLGEPTVSAPGEDVYLGGDGRQAVIRYDEKGVVSEALWWPAPGRPADEGQRMGGCPGE